MSLQRGLSVSSEVEAETSSSGQGPALGRRDRAGLSAGTAAAGHGHAANWDTWEQLGDDQPRWEEPLVSLSCPR